MIPIKWPTAEIVEAERETWARAVNPRPWAIHLNSLTPNPKSHTLNCKTIQLGAGTLKSFDSPRE